MRLKEIVKLTWVPVVLASLCCLSPIVVLLTGLGTVAFASSLADTLYGDYKWIFRGVGLIALVIALVVYLRRTKGICTLDEARKRRTEIFNIVVVALAAGVVGYVVFLYVIVHYAGVFLNLWS